MIKKRIRTWNSGMQKGYKSISRLSNLVEWLTQSSLGRPVFALEKHEKSDECTKEESAQFKKTIHSNMEAEASFALANERSQTSFLTAPVDPDPYSTICTADLLFIPLTSIADNGLVMHRPPKGSSHRRQSFVG